MFSQSSNLSAGRISQQDTASFILSTKSGNSHKLPPFVMYFLYALTRKKPRLLPQTRLFYLTCFRPRLLWWTPLSCFSRPRRKHAPKNPLSMSYKNALTFSPAFPCSKVRTRIFSLHPHQAAVFLLRFTQSTLVPIIALRLSETCCPEGDPASFR